MTAPRILVVDDEADLRELLEITLLKMGLDVDCAASVGAARDCLAAREYDLVLTDMRLPDGMGIELVREVNAAQRNTPIAVITAYGSADNAVAALKAGAFDYLSKPVGLDQLRLMVQSALRIQRPAPDSSQPSVQAGRPVPRLIGESAAMRDLRAQIARLARSMAPVAITGESGSGKELAARDIHAHSARADKPFIAVNCGAIPEALMEAEFFGYRKGAFTGASDDRDGFFQAANGGTLLLDEVADLPLPMQVKLLRAIQERRVRKVGATVEEPVDVRLVSATHQNLAECVEKGRFRQDLYYRLNVIELRLPPLRERRDDIGLLSRALLDKLSPPGQRAELTPTAEQALQSYSFPGNVRELENILERALAFAADGLIDVPDLALKPVAPGLADAQPAVPSHAPEPATAVPVTPAAAGPVTAASTSPAAPAQATAEEVSPAATACFTDFLDRVEREMLAAALSTGSREDAARALGLTPRQLAFRLRRLKLAD
ncbi:sigma-54-dependent transcriptional regulator [Noviherbaspirillum galbum]|uniref:Sigma-54-dependent Fis family transcriptional regulator n=1 Tax=Noviherbaspirillum galbum TaxID=2709383 RepID=A0A6B3SV92_9BURK|nr:sigma-54 dependent transcriptional regulator [Noviherbaspirillum galbum]NEX64431.1 sigma-54-dependent Fis family transcriptional regulator [Noviherbaspirillum galbum]